ncbi:MAG: hypothetical protein FWD87_00055 [Spirochaetaceae bacterium]|nr:hypothetical protein [Spirochaetaceae bacterium]
MNRRIILIILFVLIAGYMFTQLEPAELKEKFTTIHPITAISLVIIVAYIVVRIKYKKKQTEEDEADSTKSESPADSDKTAEDK